MRRALQLIAALLAVAVMIAWAAMGANCGWTKTKTQVKTTEPVTGLEEIRWEDKFQPGVDILATALLGAGALAAISVSIKQNQTKPK